jgi:hypothetical protein
MLPTIENTLLCFNLNNVTIGHQIIAKDGNINHGKLTPVEKLIDAKNSIIIRLPTSEKPIV